MNNNREKDRATIERTFEQLLILADSLSKEEQRAVKQGLDEDTLALFHLLLKPDLTKQDIARIKKVAIGLYKTLKAEIDRIQHFAAKQSTRDEITVTIKNYLWDEETGLPESFDEEEIDQKAEDVFTHLLVSMRSPITPEVSVSRAVM